ncbi:mediator of RNA polymerase II transcription subunit 22 isoform X2 [Salmo salar]|uniref:Mediator of RNA polymerase II transcription subunit 22 n=1 Tax=Salmo salar TaxID=8030 RepID=A0ABM3CGS4_SALSA|nr:mediator of RNA polymerase II transcription subunit 22 isoform X2 [Salmo trutta]XP_045545758.1 mediator of RNA polymerase II transcription subunit 22 isoform X2 [Salmo salar]
MASQRALPQSKESLLQNYNKRLKDDIRSILDNLTEIIKTAKESVCLSLDALVTPARLEHGELEHGECLGWLESLAISQTPPGMYVLDAPSDALGRPHHPLVGPSSCRVVEDETQVSRATQAEQDHYEMHVRAANIVRAGESLMKLVSDLKQFLILNDFPSVNEAISLQNQQLRSLQEECDKKLTSLRDEIAIDLYELEEEYYSSRYK